MEHVTTQLLGRHTARPDLASGLVSVGRRLASLGSWLATDPIGDRLERQREYDEQMLRRY